MEAEARFPEAVSGVVDAYENDGLVVALLVDSPGFARLGVTDPGSGRTSKVELGIDWRAHPPTVLAIGPVLHPDDAVANKVCALYSRAQARDYIDVAAALSSDRYDGDDLLRLAAEHDPGFDTMMFADALLAVRRLPSAEFTAYGLEESDAADLVQRLTEWARSIGSR